MIYYMIIMAFLEVVLLGYGWVLYKTNLVCKHPAIGYNSKNTINMSEFNLGFIQALYGKRIYKTGKQLIPYTIFMELLLFVSDEAQFYLVMMSLFAQAISIGFILYNIEKDIKELNCITTRLDKIYEKDPEAGKRFREAKDLVNAICKGEKDQSELDKFFNNEDDKE